VDTDPAALPLSVSCEPLLGHSLYLYQDNFYILYHPIILGTKLGDIFTMRIAEEILVRFQEKYVNGMSRASQRRLLHSLSTVREESFRSSYSVETGYSLYVYSDFSYLLHDPTSLDTITGDVFKDLYCFNTHQFDF